MAAIARAEVPQAGVAAQPGGADGARGVAGGAQPIVVGVGGILEVEIEEVIGGRAAGRGPATDVLVEAARQITAVLEEVQELGMLAGEGDGVDAVRGRARLGGDADAETRKLSQRCRHATIVVRSRAQWQGESAEDVEERRGTERRRR